MRNATSRTGIFDRRTFIIGAIAVGSAHITLRIDAASQGVRPRKSVGLLETDPAELQLLRDSIGLLQAKDIGGPASDGWIALSDPHSQNCFTNDAREIHFSWWFLPWHRAYLHAIERRLQHVVSEPQLRLPYWDWFTAVQLPDAFAKSNYAAGGATHDNPLFDPTRAQNP